MTFPMTEYLRNLLTSLIRDERCFNIHKHTYRGVISAKGNGSYAHCECEPSARPDEDWLSIGCGCESRPVAHFVVKQRREDMLLTSRLRGSYVVVVRPTV